MLDGGGDNWLVDRARAGSIDAFEALARLHRDRVYRTALRLTGNPHDAEDVAQEALVQAWKHLNAFRGDSTFATWLYRIVVTKTLNLQRSTRRIEVTDQVPDSATPGADRLAEQHQRSNDLAKFIAALPFDRRAPLVLHQFEGLSYDQIAVVLEITTEPSGCGSSAPGVNSPSTCGNGGDPRAPPQRRSPSLRR